MQTSTSIIGTTEQMHTDEFQHRLEDLEQQFKAMKKIQVRTEQMWRI